MVYEVGKTVKGISIYPKLASPAEGNCIAPLLKYVGSTVIVDRKYALLPVCVNEILFQKVDTCTFGGSLLIVWAAICGVKVVFHPYLLIVL